MQAVRCCTASEVQVLIMTNHQLMQRLQAGPGAVTFLERAGLGRAQMMGIIQRCGGGGFCKVLLVWLTARCARRGGLAEELRAAWAPGITSA